MKNIIGIDIGGTKTAVVLGNENGEIIKKFKFSTPDTYSEAIKLIEQDVELLLGESISPPTSIGISCGGPLDCENGMILSPPNLPTWINIPIVEILKNKFKIDTFLENDANACCLAEWKWGAGRGMKNVIFLTFGTGLGAGFILDNKLYRGSNFLAGEVGHIRLANEGVEAYGKIGSAESFCSGAGIKKLAVHLGMSKGITTKQVFEEAANGNSTAQEVIKLSSLYLGRLLAILIDILNPDCIILGSVFTRQAKIFEQYINKIISDEALPLSSKHCKIYPSKLSESLGDKAAICVGLSKSK